MMAVLKSAASLAIFCVLPQATRADVAADAIILKGHPQKCLDLQGGDTTNGNTLQIWDCNGMHTQGWVFKGNRLVYKANQTKCVDLRGGKAENGQPIQIWDCVGEWNSIANNQEWSYESGEFGIYHKASDSKKCIDLRLVDTRNGNEVQLWDCDGSAGQKWTFADEDLSEDHSAYIAAIVLLALALVCSLSVNIVLCFLRRRYRPTEEAHLKDPTKLGNPALDNTA
eukprot:TRINITY_DN14212_c0_g1_i1.p1 TRINITY_DN14212_c0_g1~~TRINITY_DN14212_c0_g1_i1.p1  ORF type:complete len:226 (-),score=69.31 TRINITY_DN14212_c0_g1_i1:295-972(-)